MRLKRLSVFPSGSSQGYIDWLRVIIRSDEVICISSTVANELSDWISANEDSDRIPTKISWVHIGADIENSVPSTGLPDDAESVLQTLNQQTTFLMVGTLEPRKGHAQVLNAFDVLWKDGFNANLVIVGKKGWLIEDLVERLEHHPQKNKKLYWLPSVSDAYLAEIYSSSDALIAASYGEGFGLPLIEAAQHNLPIIARDIPVFREVAGNSAYYFSSVDGAELGADLLRWTNLKNGVGIPISGSIAWSTWSECAVNLIRKIER